MKSLDFFFSRGYSVFGSCLLLHPSPAGEVLGKKEG